MENKSLTIEQREVLETFYTHRRIIELAVRPVTGNFNSAHLREVNQRIFQDLPGLGFNDVTPGQYRPPLSKGQDWVKNRLLATVEGSFTVAYSSMDLASQRRLDKVLHKVDPVKFRELTTAEFAETISTLYAELDYIHPFSDGNSRTLRTFTKQIADESGFQLDWMRFNKDDAARDTLYIARDLSVNELAAPYVESGYTMQRIMHTHMQLRENRNLPALLRDAVQRNRAGESPKHVDVDMANTRDQTDIRQRETRQAELIKGRISEISQYLALPHIEKMAKLFAEHNPIGDNLGKEEMIEKFKTGLGTLYQQGKEISPMEVQIFEARLVNELQNEDQKDRELER